MDLLKTQLARIQQQLSGLSASQKMLTGALITIMVMTLFWWGSYAGKSEMSPVLDQSFSQDDIARITMRIASKGINYRVDGDRVMVPEDRRMEVVADLAFSRMLPRDTAQGFDQIALQMSPWDSQTKTEAMLNRAKEGTLAAIMRDWPDIATSNVMIDPTSVRKIGRTVQPTATINLTTRSGQKVNRKLVEAAADLVAGAQAGIAKSSIKVIVDGISYPVGDNDSNYASMSDIIEQKHMHEQIYEQKISDQLGWLQGVLVAVHVEVDARATQTQQRTVDKDNFIHKPIKSKSRTEENNSSSGPGGEAGVGPNVGISTLDPPALPAGNTSTVEETDDQFQLLAGETIENSTKPAGSHKAISASVRVPVSYFVASYKRRTGSENEPSEEELEKLFQAELPLIRNDVKRITNIIDDDAVTVQTYLDLSYASTGSTAEAASGISSMARGFTKEIAVGALALISLFMVTMMVRRSSPAPVIAVPTEPELPAQLIAHEHVAGEAIEGDSMLDGMELDDDAVRTQQMLDQVQKMVKENPESAANLVKRWLNRS